MGQIGVANNKQNGSCPVLLAQVTHMVVCGWAETHAVPCEGMLIIPTSPIIRSKQCHYLTILVPN